MSEKLFAGIDIGATNIKYGLVDASGSVRFKSKTVTPESVPPDKLFEQVQYCGEQLLIVADEEEGVVEHIGVGSPGTINIQTGVVEGTCPNLPGWPGFHLRDRLKDQLNLPVFVDNDANCASLAEYRFGAGIGFTDIICLTVGTGIGGTLIINGKMHRGHDYAAGEIGHMLITCFKDNEIISEPLEKLVSSKSIIAAVEERLKDTMTPAFENQIGENLERLTIRRIFTAIKRGDKGALEVVQKSGELLGLALASLVNVFNPQVIILGGGVAEGGSDFVDIVRKTVLSSSLVAAIDSLQIIPAKLGNDAGFIGAAFLGEEIGERKTS